jgi:hypothetical protein
MGIIPAGQADRVAHLWYEDVYTYIKQKKMQYHSASENEVSNIFPTTYLVIISCNY